MQSILDDMAIRLNACHSNDRICYDVVGNENDHFCACEAFFPALKVKTQFSLHCRSSSLLCKSSLISAYRLR
jgi:hypothetical protein